MGNQLCESVDKQPEKLRRQLTINTISQIGQETKHEPYENHARHTVNADTIHIKLEQAELQYYQEQLPNPKQSRIRHTKPKYQPLLQIQTKSNSKISLTPNLLYQTNQHSTSHQQIITVIYKQYIIHSHPSHLRQSQKSSYPLITGHSKVYSLQNQKQLLYQGQLKNSKFDGYGKMYQQKKLIYQGEFKNGVFDGWGITQNYIGEWRQGLYDGYGIYQQFSQNNPQIVTFYYEGYFQNGLYSGSGVLIKSINIPVKQITKIHQKNGIIDYLNSQIQHGMNIIKKYKAQQIYIGQFSNGFRHGFGRLFTQKMEFSGQFSHNLYHGLGTIFNHTNEGKKVVKAVFKMGKQFKQ